MPLSGRSEGAGVNVITGCCGGRVDDPDEGATPGISKPRGCTDVVWLVFYVMFCCILILVGVFAIVYGNPKRLINGMDSFGNVCGTTNENFGNMTYSGMDMTDKPYVFYFDPNDMDRSTKVCVSECPKETLRSMEELKEYFLNTTVNYCRYDFKLESWEKVKTGGIGAAATKMDFDDILCPEFPVYSSHAVLKRCVPRGGTTKSLEPKLFFNVYGYLNDLNIFKQILGDLAVTWVTVLWLTALSFVISLILVVVLHLITTVVAYVILILSALLSVAFTGFLWWTYADLKGILDSTDEDMILEEMAKNERAFLTYSIISTIFTVGLLLVVLVIRKRVGVVVRLFREAASAMKAMPCLVLQPFITYAALTVFFCCWLYVVLCLATADYPTTRQIPSISSSVDESLSENVTETSESPPGELSASSSSRLNKTIRVEDLTGWTLIEYSDEAWVKYMWWLYVFGLIWCSEFILACQQMVIASSVSSWYFCRARGSLNCIVFKSITRMIQYHIGSVALGSLIITLIKIPRLIMQFSQRVFRKWEDYTVVNWLNKCCICCLKCFENCMKYVHHNAYTVISIQGVDFCPASRLAFSALLQNALQISVINSIGDFVLFLGKCIVAALTGLIALLVFRSDETLYFYAIPVLLTVIFSYFVAHCVISVFEMAVDTLFLCFCEDHNMNDGTDGKEFYAPRSLLQYMTIDAVDAVAPGRNAQLESLSVAPASVKKSAVDAKEGTAEEIIPMNPYGQTTTPND